NCLIPLNAMVVMYTVDDGIKLVSNRYRWCFIHHFQLRFFFLTGEQSQLFADRYFWLLKVFFEYPLCKRPEFQLGEEGFQLIRIRAGIFISSGLNSMGTS